MANISVFKITVKYGTSKTGKELYAVRYRENGEFSAYLAGDGAIYSTKPQQYGFYIASMSGTRGVPEEAKNIFKEMLKNRKAEEKAEEEKKKAEETVWKLKSERSKMEKELTAAFGLLTDSEFCDAFLHALPANVSFAISRGNFRMDISDDSLRIYREEYIEKYFRQASFVYEEYDGTIFLKDNAERTKEYREYLNEYSRTLPVKAKIAEWLSIGDKDCLTYHGEYRIPLKSKKDKKYAEELAKKFAS